MDLNEKAIYIGLGYREFTSYQISFNTKICIPFESEVGEILVDKYEESYHELCNSGDILWGQPETFSSNPKQDAYFCRNGLGKLMFNYYKSEEQVREEVQEAKENGNTEYAQILQNEVLPLLIDYKKDIKGHNEGIENWHLLLKLSSIDEVGMCWWDAGYLEFMINKDDLKNLNFDNAYANISSS